MTRIGFLSRPWDLFFRAIIGSIVAQDAARRKENVTSAVSLPGRFPRGRFFAYKFGMGLSFRKLTDSTVERRYGLWQTYVLK